MFLIKFQYLNILDLIVFRMDNAHLKIKIVNTTTFFFLLEEVNKTKCLNLIKKI